MTKEEVRSTIEATGIIPAIRVSSADDALFVAEAISAGGIPIVEVTMTVPGALKVISALVKNDPAMIVGAGTVLEVEAARHALDAGARFITSTGFDRDVVEFSLQQNVVVFPGALTPSEVMTAWKAGSDFVKIFPCSQVGGVGYIAALRAPFPQIPLIATGGVRQQTAADFILAGADAIGVGSGIIPHKAIELRQPDRIHELARRFVHIVTDARRQRAAK